MCNLFANQDPARYVSTTRRMRLNGQSTSLRLERAFWDILDRLAAELGLTTQALVSKLHSEVLEIRGEPENFTSLLRCACLIHVSTPLQGASGTAAHPPARRPSGPLRGASAVN